MREYVEDREYVQPECETVDWVVWAEYVEYTIRQSRKDGQDTQTE